MRVETLHHLVSVAVHHKQTNRNAESLHINTISAKASKCLYFLKQLKRADVPTDQQLHFYVAVNGLSSSTAHRFGTMLSPAHKLNTLIPYTKRAIRIIFPFTREISYPYALFAADLNSLHSIRHDISKCHSFKTLLCDPSSCMHHLFPPPQDTSVLSRLRTVTPLPRLTSCTKTIVHTLYSH